MMYHMWIAWFLDCTILSAIQHRHLFQTTKTVLPTFLCVVAAFYFESKGSLGRVESIINMEREGWQIFLACLQPPSPFPFASCTTTPVNSSAHSTPTPQEMPTLQTDQGQNLLGVAWILSNMAPQVVHVIKCLCEKWANHVDFHQ